MYEEEYYRNITCTSLFDSTRRRLKRFANAHLGNYDNNKRKTLCRMREAQADVFRPMLHRATKKGDIRNHFFGTSLAMFVGTSVAMLSSSVACWCCMLHVATSGGIHDNKRMDMTTVVSKRLSDRRWMV
jgi:hypothetical protein